MANLPHNLSHRLALGLTLLNAVILFITNGEHVQGVFAEPSRAPVLRGRALEIVDDRNRVRASISVHGPTTVDGVLYPETVLFRMTDPTSGPVVKLTAAANGSALGLSDDTDGGIQLYARDTSSVIRIIGKTGNQRIIKP